MKKHRMQAKMLLFVTILSSVLLFQPRGNCAKLPDIYWNSSNPIFRIDNTDHIFDVNKKQNDHDQVDLVCPSPAQPTQAASAPAQAGLADSNRTQGDQERYIIYNVSKEEYDTCRLNGPNARVVAVCDQAQGKNRTPFTVTFRSFTPQPNGLEFKPGQDYYFISALPGAQYASDPARRFSPCRELNMKVIFKVCCKPPGSGPVQRPALLNQTRVVPASSPSAARSVVTIRPSLAPKPAAPTAPVSPLEDLMRKFSDSQSVHVQQQQPITVLPIEVLQPSSSEPTAGSVQDQPAMPNEIHNMLSDQTSPRPQVQTSSLRHYERYTPTPIPKSLLRLSSQAERQFPPSQPTNEHTAALWSLPPQQLRPFYHQHQSAATQLSSLQQQQQQQPLAPVSAQPHRGLSRSSYYPHWLTAAYDQRTEQQQQTARDLITVQDSQASSGSSNRLSLDAIGLLSALLLHCSLFALLSLACRRSSQPSETWNLN